ncbi:sugar phosphate isomerase/epimerase [Terribacillus sp. DMT04]|uniref:sugar phosphate isomerase/epimerase family protein n=1 Tax=Terribacillus sp. DMT04 TaxID=2850441 RepID=UPI001C2C8EA4|nr:TIM barrel protein [Terribacillus sp. DMT04]QXE00899.1 sugar phosphate isomerase/epimerase [Terribacillus sp. DMT04]
MGNQFSLAHLTALACPPPKLTYIAARAGYDFVSIRPISMMLKNEPDYNLAKNKSMLRDTKTALHQTGLQVLDIELAKIEDGMEAKQYEPAFEVGAELGARHVLCSVWTDDDVFANERFIELCELAKCYQLTIELEFVPVASVATLTQAIRMLHAAAQDNAGLLIDAHHFHRAQENVSDINSVPASWFHMFHLCDAVKEIPSAKEQMIKIMREERLYIGEGGIPIKEILQQMPTIPYSLEIPHLQRAKELGFEEYSRRCLVSAKKYISLFQDDINIS